MNIKELMNDTQILDAVIQKCIDYSDTDWSKKDNCPVGAFTDIAWFIMSKRKSLELGVDIPTSTSPEEFWSQVDSLQDVEAGNDDPTVLDKPDDIIS
jgi:hypothetical protein